MAAGQRRQGHSRHGDDGGFSAMPLSITVKNFGPISHGTIKMRPLTVLIGPSNAGKSYIARLAYRINRSCQMLCSDTNMLLVSLFAARDPDSAPKEYLDVMGRMMSMVERGFHNRNVPVPAALLSRFQLAISSSFPDILVKELGKEFGSDVGTLARFSTREFSARISGPLRVAMRWSGSMEATCQSTAKSTYQIVQDPNTHSVELVVSSRGKTETLPIRNRSFAELDLGVFVDLVARQLGYAMVGSIKRSILESLETQFFFSVARSPLDTLLESGGGGHESTAQPGSDAVHGHDLPGLPEGFVKTMMSINTEKPGPLSDLAESMEREMFGGTIDLSKPIDRGIPLISLEANGNKVPLHRMSSHVRSLALLTIYLKHVVIPGQRIIVEEPEAHMHPANQLLFAKYVALLIRRGVRVTLITHSVLMFERLSTYMALSGLTPSQRKRVISSPEAYINLEEVSAHQFLVKPKGRCVITDIPSTQAYGLDQEQFGKMTFEMYRERASVQERLEEFTDDPE